MARTCRLHGALPSSAAAKTRCPVADRQLTSRLQLLQHGQPAKMLMPSARQSATLANMIIKSRAMTPQRQAEVMRHAVTSPLAVSDSFIVCANENDLYRIYIVD